MAAPAVSLLVTTSCVNVESMEAGCPVAREGIRGCPGSSSHVEAVIGKMLVGQGPWGFVQGSSCNAYIWEAGWCHQRLMLELGSFSQDGRRKVVIAGKP